MKQYISYHLRCNTNTGELVAYKETCSYIVRKARCKVPLRLRKYAQLIIQDKQVDFDNRPEKLEIPNIYGTKETLCSISK